MKLFNKKGGLSMKMIVGSIIGLILLVVFFEMLSVTIPDAQEAGNQLNDSNQCIRAGCIYNATNSTGGLCGSGADTQDIPCPTSSANTSIPLNALFSGDGIVFLIIMAAILIIVVVAYLKFKKTK